APCWRTERPRSNPRRRGHQIAPGSEAMWSAQAPHGARSWGDRQPLRDGRLHPLIAVRALREERTLETHVTFGEVRHDEAQKAGRVHNRKRVVARRVKGRSGMGMDLHSDAATLLQQLAPQLANRLRVEVIAPGARRVM